jgi:hypothetical protein
MKILFTTNGHGKDLVAARITQALGDKRIKIDVLPVVGNGAAFKKLNVRIIGPKNILPGGGFGLRNYGYLPKDPFSGIIDFFKDLPLTLKKRRLIQKTRKAPAKEIRKYFVVGDSLKKKTCEALAVILTLMALVCLFGIKPLLLIFIIYILTDVLLQIVFFLFYPKLRSSFKSTES